MYGGKYNDDNVIPSDIADPIDNTLVLPPADIDPIHGGQLNNTITQSQSQSQLETITYLVQETFPDVASILDHWDIYISENERTYGRRRRKGWSRRQRKRFLLVNIIVRLLQNRIIELEHDNVL